MPPPAWRKNPPKSTTAAVSPLAAALLVTLFLLRAKPASALGPAARSSSDQTTQLLHAAHRDAVPENARGTARLEFVELGNRPWPLVSETERSLLRKGQIEDRRRSTASSRRRLRSSSRQQVAASEHRLTAAPPEPFPWRTLSVLGVFWALLRWRWLGLRDC